MEGIPTREVAKILHCSPGHVTILVKRGHFPHAYKLDPTRRNSPIRIPRNDIEAYILRQKLTQPAV